MIGRILLLVSLLTLGGCATTLDGSRYAEHKPGFDLFSFFEGDVTAWGIVQNRSGEIVQRFEVDIVGTVAGNTITLDETFEYFVGEGPIKRVWVITRNDDGSYSGSAGDIAGPAAGVPYGNAFRWTYEMDLPVDGQTYRVSFEDWFFAIDDNRLINRSYIQKFGLDMAEVTIFMERR